MANRCAPDGGWHWADSEPKSEADNSAAARWLRMGVGAGRATQVSDPPGSEGVSNLSQLHNGTLEWPASAVQSIAWEGLHAVFAQPCVHKRDKDSRPPQQSPLPQHLALVGAFCFSIQSGRSLSDAQHPDGSAVRARIEQMACAELRTPLTAHRSTVASKR